MKIKAYIIQTMCIAAAIFAISGCSKDNYKAPTSVLSGHVLYNGAPVGVRSIATSQSGGAQLELWQHGYQLFTKIPIQVAYDGSYSALLFDGDYLLVKTAGAPWLTPTDSTAVHVSGNTIQDVTVTPYFVVTNVAYTHTTTTVTATFTIVKPAGSTATLTAARLYLGRTTLLDGTFNDANFNVPAASITVGSPTTASITIPVNLAPGGIYASQAAGGIYARVGVLSTGSAELEYSAPVFIPLP